MLGPGKPFQTFLMFVGTTRNQPKSGALGWTLDLLTNIRLDLKGLPGDKHSSLLRTLVNYNSKMLYNLE